MVTDLQGEGLDVGAHRTHPILATRTRLRHDTIMTQSLHMAEALSAHRTHPILATRTRLVELVLRLVPMSRNGRHVSRNGRGRSHVT